MSRIVDTYSKDYPMIEGSPCTNYNAEDEFLYQINRCFPNIFHFDVLSRKGKETRIDCLLKGSFLGDKYSNNFFYVYVFILYEGGRRRKYDDELRTQLGSHLVWTPDLSTLKPATNFRDNSSIGLMNQECYCIGIYKQDEECHDVVFVGMPAEVLCKSETEIINPTSTFQTHGEMFVREAFLEGVKLHQKTFTASSTYNLFLFKPEYLLYYMKQRDEIHIGDIDRANAIVSNIKKIATNLIINEEDKEFDYKGSYLSAVRTKPFLLLAGISGTGKSRIVKKMAFNSCPEVEDFQDDLTSPGNYQLIEVKPNWHDSTEVLGYESEIEGRHYVVTPFIKFLVKAMSFPEIPFFVCMDEMNLAPVEQYFAEFLSVLESRKLVDGKITSEPLVKADVFKQKYDSKHDIFVKLGLKKIPTSVGKAENDKLGENATTEAFERQDIVDELKNNGLRLPQNLIIVGTVNMDETTHQFSRKVIDRAMTIEMNIADGIEPFKDFFNNKEELRYRNEPISKDFFLCNFVQAPEAMESDLLKEADCEYLKTNVPLKLSELNTALKNTPFKIAYRVQNELVLYFASLRQENSEVSSENLFKTALDGILMMKVLPRIEGDEDLLENPLQELANYTQDLPQSAIKIEEMKERLERAHFTSFWP